MCFPEWGVLGGHLKRRERRFCQTVQTYFDMGADRCHLMSPTDVISGFGIGFPICWEMCTCQEDSHTGAMIHKFNIPTIVISTWGTSQGKSWCCSLWHLIPFNIAQRHVWLCLVSSRFWSHLSWSGSISANLCAIPATVETHPGSKVSRHHFAGNGDQCRKKVPKILHSCIRLIQIGFYQNPHHSNKTQFPVSKMQMTICIKLCNWEESDRAKLVGIWWGATVWSASPQGGTSCLLMKPCMHLHSRQDAPCFILTATRFLSLLYTWLQSQFLGWRGISRPMILVRWPRRQNEKSHPLVPCKLAILSHKFPFRALFVKAVWFLKPLSGRGWCPRLGRSNVGKIVMSVICMVWDSQTLMSAD